MVYKALIHALNKALDELTEEELRYCKMVADKESEYEVSKERGIHPTILSTRKNAALEELGKKMKDYR